MSDPSLNPNWPAELDHPLVERQDRRNIIDYYKYWNEEAIKTHLDQRRHSFAVMVENLAIDYNVGTVLRNCNAFLAKEMWIAGSGSWDRRGAMGVQNYEHVRKTKDSREVIQEYKGQGYKIIAIDNQPGAENMLEFDWPKESLMVFGQESIGVSPWSMEAADHLVYIPQWGSVRSLNVGVASGLAMFSWANQHASQPTGFPEEGLFETS